MNNMHEMITHFLLDNVFRVSGVVIDFVFVSRLFLPVIRFSSLLKINHMFTSFTV